MLIDESIVINYYRQSISIISLSIDYAWLYSWAEGARQCEG